MLFCAIYFVQARTAAMAWLAPPFLLPEIGWIDPQKRFEGSAPRDYRQLANLLYDTHYLAHLSLFGSRNNDYQRFAHRGRMSLVGRLPSLARKPFS
jgi:hypothetical protein